MLKLPNLHKLSLPNFQSVKTDSNVCGSENEIKYAQYWKEINSLMYDCIDHVTGNFIDNLKQRFLQRIIHLSEAMEFKLVINPQSEFNFK